MTYRKIESPQLMASLKRVREGAVEQKFRTAAEIQAKTPSVSVRSIPDPTAKFDAGPGVEGDITAVVGGATDKPIPSAPKNVEPKGAVGLGEHTGGLLEAKRRAQQKIKQQQEQN